MPDHKPQSFPSRTGKTPPGYQETIRESLLEAGFSEDAAMALLSFDLDQFQHMRRVMKGDVPMMLMRELGAELEGSHFHALTAVTRIQHGIHRDGPTEATVGLLALELNIDPSRASRIVADLVDRGFLARAAAQDDGRRSILTLTPKAKALFEAFRMRKWQKTIEVFKGWPEQDIIRFAELFARYLDGMAQQYPAVKGQGA